MEFKFKGKRMKAEKSGGEESGAACIHNISQDTIAIQYPPQHDCQQDIAHRAPNERSLGSQRHYCRGWIVQSHELLFILQGEVSFNMRALLMKVSR